MKKKKKVLIYKEYIASNTLKLSSFFKFKYVASEVLKGRKDIFGNFRQLSEFFGKYFENL